MHSRIKVRLVNYNTQGARARVHTHTRARQQKKAADVAPGGL